MEYKDPKEEEWEKFQKMIQVESKVQDKPFSFPQGQLMMGKIHLKCNHMVNINVLDFFEILGISCDHQGKIEDKIFFCFPMGFLSYDCLNF